jgi:hypothetical protein
VDAWASRCFGDDQGVIRIIFLLSERFDVLRRDQRNPIAAIREVRPQ